MDQVSVVNDGRPAQARAVQEHGPRTHRTRRTRTAPHPPRYRHRIDDLRKSLQTEMISPPLWPRLFWYLFLLSGSIHFRGIFVANMRLVRLFPDACNGDVTHYMYMNFWSGCRAFSARSAAEIEMHFVRLRSVPERKSPSQNRFGPHAEHFQRDLLLKRASRVSAPDKRFPSQNILVRMRSLFSAICC